MFQFRRTAAALLAAAAASRTTPADTATGGGTASAAGGAAGGATGGATGGAATGASGGGTASGGSSGGGGGGGSGGEGRGGGGRGGGGSGGVCNEKERAGRRIEGLPDFGLKEVAVHKNIENGVWVSYGSGVFDISAFVRRHPGGSSRLLLAAGGGLEPFWNVYAVHHQPAVYAMLSDMRIGNLVLTEEEAAQQKQEAKNGVL
eukprot:GHVS01095683.1.p1 GENE.GHVS01095683.1~~GHVS01095683.1.p1  ORF type:complete len:203 (+),score=96.29 GHVS01095683.1:182-790(+)